MENTRWIAKQEIVPWGIFYRFELYNKAKWNGKRTLEYYTWHIKKFFEYTNCDFTDFWNLKNFREKYYIIINRNISNEWKKKYLKCCRIFSDFLIEEEIISLNAPRLINPPKVQTRLPIVVEDEEIKNIYEAIDKRWFWFLKLRNSMLIRTFLSTWLRRNEVLNLKRQDIFYDKIFVKKGKWWKDRFVYISEEFHEKLDYYIKATAWVSEYLFYSNRKNKLNESSIKEIFKEIKKISWIDKFHPHRLRHTYASRMVEKWVDIWIIREQMWHSNISTTNRYIAVRDSHRKKVIQNLRFSI